MRPLKTILTDIFSKTRNVCLILKAFRSPCFFFCPADKMLIMFLHTCYYKVDAAYKMIVAHYKYRRETPECFSTYDPTDEEMQRVFASM